MLLKKRLQSLVQVMLKVTAVTFFGLVALVDQADGQLLDRFTSEYSQARFEANTLFGNQPGIQEGSTGIGGFVPLTGDANRLLFLDGTGNINLETGNGSADIGLGMRFLNGANNTVFGGNIYYNFRDADSDFGRHSFQSVGFGLEALFSDWAVRSNTAFSLDHGHLTNFGAGALTLVPQVGGPAGVHNISLITQIQRSEEALNSFDLNVSRSLSFLNTELGAGTYYLGSSQGPSGWGASGTAEIWVKENVAFSMNLTHDPLFDTMVSGGVTVLFGGPGVDVASRQKNPRSNLWSRVQRRRVMPVLSNRIDTIVNATDPTTGNVITVTSIAGGDDLEGAPALNTDIILVDTNAIFTGLNPIVLNDGQRLLSASVLHTVDTDEMGTIMLPGTNLGGVTTLDQSTGNAIGMADNAEVSGFTVTNATGHGIFGNKVNGYDINRNFLNTNQIMGLRLDGENGSLYTGLVMNNTANGNGEKGFLIEDVVDAIISGNTVNGNTHEGIVLTNVTNSTVSANTTNGNTQAGMSISTFNSGNISGNTATGNTLRGITINRMNDGNVLSNTVSGNSEEGLYIGRLVDGVVSNNISNINGGHGIYFGNLDGGTISSNTASDNADKGFHLSFIFGTNSLEFSLNNSIDNTNEGYDITGTPAVGSPATNSGSGNGSNNTYNY